MDSHRQMFTVGLAPQATTGMVPPPSTNITVAPHSAVQLVVPVAGRLPPYSTPFRKRPRLRGAGHSGRRRPWRFPGTRGCRTTNPRPPCMGAWRARRWRRCDTATARSIPASAPLGAPSVTLRRAPLRTKTLSAQALTGLVIGARGADGAARRG